MKVPKKSNWLTTSKRDKLVTIMKGTILRLPSTHLYKSTKVEAKAILRVVKVRAVLRAGNPDTLQLIAEAPHYSKARLVNRKETKEVAKG